MHGMKLKAMKVFEKPTELSQWSKTHGTQGKSIGLVPTMGYLHNGHLSLVKRCKEIADLVVVSIFVNPTQFGPKEDLDAYPRDLERDLEQLRSLGVDAVFTPTASSMYQQGHSTYVDEASASLGLCGKSRPGHFKGVLTICCKLFNLSKCNVAVFGQKDAQQVTLIEKMVRELNMNLEIVRVPIGRDTDGLALSSRNAYLSPAQRKKAPLLHQSLRVGVAGIESGKTRSESIIREMRKILDCEPEISIDYLEVVDRQSMQPMEEIKKGSVLLAGAIYIGKTRLIDNLPA